MVLSSCSRSPEHPQSNKPTPLQKKHHRYIITSNILFQPYTLGAITLSNRIVMAPLTRNRAGARRPAK